ncbi:hypothetical protein KFE25_012504 [Diacronema lutheri]|uniref:Uncharacterized protein n=2 Tax=Diacronema lutheri TaxID=2081491 RepID=A0A8J6CBI5_DIALT|nr:hypothetical protein KFE25_012504 [Diacronema lutheri]
MVRAQMRALGAGVVLAVALAGAASSAAFHLLVGLRAGSAIHGASEADVAEWQRQTDEVREQKRVNDQLREANRLAFANGDPGARPRRLGVCVSGQMARLELAQKVDHLLRPNRDDFVVDIVLALAVSPTPAYGNGDLDVGGRVRWTNETIRDAIGDSLGNGTVVIDNSPQYANPMVQSAYAYQRDPARGPTWNRNHVKMWSEYWLCYQQFTRLEQANGAPYDVLVKVRDDGWLTSDVKLSGPPLEPMWKGRVILSQCRPEGGWNDRWAIMDAAHGYAYFGAQFADYYLNFDELWRTTWNVSEREPGSPETHLRGALALYNASVLAVDADTVPILQGRLAPDGLGGARFCINLHSADLGHDPMAAACVPTDPLARAKLYCSRCDDGAMGHVSSCERTCACLRASDSLSECNSTVMASADFCLTSAVFNQPIEHAECGMCLRHRCSLWGGNKCASRWGFTDPQGEERVECECSCCRQACGHRVGLLVAAAGAKRARSAASPGHIVKKGTSIVASAGLHVPIRASEADVAEWQRQTDEVREQKRVNDQLREANRLAFADGDPGARPRRLGVCVSGQMARLELAQKVDHLLRPNRDDFVVDIVLALAVSPTPAYGNGDLDVGGRVRWTNETIRDAIGDSLGNGTVVIDNSPQYANPMVQSAYAYQRDPARGPTWNRNHVKMWSEYWLCYQQFTRLEQANGAPYDVLVKVRDDGWLTSDVKLSGPPLEPMWKGRVILSQCRPEGGWNDRWAIMDAAHGYAYFGAQFADYYLNFDELWRTTWNVSEREPGSPETHLRGALALYNASVLAVDADTVPILQGRLAPDGLGGARFCINLHSADLGHDPMAAACVPTDPLARAKLYCSRCDDGAMGHVSSCERTCACLRASDSLSECNSTVMASADFCLTSAVFNQPIEHAECGMCLRHRCSLWGGNKCASRWGFTDPQGEERVECECSCCRQACGHRVGLLVAAAGAKRARSAASPGHIVKKGTSIVASAGLHVPIRASEADVAEWQRQTDEVREQKRVNDQLREANRLAFADGDPGARPRRLGVCVSGQMARLELAQKVDHLLRPNRDDFVVDIVLALAVSPTPAYGNGDLDVGGRVRWTNETIRDAIGDSLGNGTVVIDNSPQYANPMLQEDYVSARDPAMGPTWNRNHVKMWSEYWLCYQQFTRLEQANGAPYDVLVKVRDDGWLTSDVKLSGPPLEPMWKGRVILSQCRPEGGWNDRWAIMDAAHGYAYFGAQLADYYLNFDELWRTTWNVSEREPGSPETHLRGALALYNASVLAVDADTVPILQGRLAPDGLGGARFCINLHSADLGHDPMAAACVPTDPFARAKLYCSRCDDGAMGHVSSCEDTCACLRASDSPSRCNETLALHADACLTAAVLNRHAIEEHERAPCGMCHRHRCSLWGGNKCASRWGFTDPQGSQRFDCECTCCRRACGDLSECGAAQSRPNRQFTAGAAPLSAPSSHARHGRLDALAAIVVATTVGVVLVGVTLATSEYKSNPLAI